MEESVQHRPVMIEEVLNYLNPQPGQTAVDCTTGEGGHAVKILERIGQEGMLIGLDKDKEILIEARKRLGDSPSVCLVHGGFDDLPGILEERQIDKVDCALFDLGISSYHLERPERGFSFMSEGPLDMRLDRTGKMSAEDIVNDFSESDLAATIRDYGEEPKAKRIAQRIAQARKEGRISTTGHLKELIVKATGGRRGAKHTATRTFQALRIAVNDELGSLHKAMNLIGDVVRPGGRVVVISFHSLEDRIVKRAFRSLAATGIAKVLTRKPVLPSKAEVESNPRSRSAKLRSLEVIH